MQALTVLYDARCELCCAARDWLESQDTIVPITLVAAGSEEARDRFPELDHAATSGRLTAVGDGGEVFHDDKAWIISLWATRQYREWASRLSAPGVRAMTRGMTAWVGRHRASLGPFARLLRG
jgi:predicted DCC family thiol-disulfide oxidoreductase YuxK